MNRLFVGILTGLAGHAALAAGDPGHPCLIEPYQRIEMRSPAEAIIDKEGDVVDARILRPLGLGCSEAALEAIRAWKYRPATLNGRHVAVYLTVTVRFQLQR